MNIITWCIVYSNTLACGNRIVQNFTHKFHYFPSRKNIDHNLSRALWKKLCVFHAESSYACRISCIFKPIWIPMHLPELPSMHLLVRLSLQEFCRQWKWCALCIIKANCHMALDYFYAPFFYSENVSASNMNAMFQSLSL